MSLSLLNLNHHIAHHLEFFFILVLAVVMFYLPPRAAAALRAFVEKHFNESIGLYLLHLGIGLIILSGVWPDMPHVFDTGNALIVAAMGLLNLQRKSAAEDTGGSTPNSTPSNSSAPTHTPVNGQP